MNYSEASLLRGISAYCVFKVVQRGAPPKRGGGRGGGRLLCTRRRCQPVAAARGLTLRKERVHAAKRGDPSRIEGTDPLRSERLQADTHQTEDTWMRTDAVQSEFTCQPVQGISGCNGEYDTQTFDR